MDGDNDEHNAEGDEGHPAECEEEDDEGNEEVEWDAEETDKHRNHLSDLPGIGGDEGEQPASVDVGLRSDVKQKRLLVNEAGQACADSSREVVEESEAEGIE